MYLPIVIVDKCLGRTDGKERRRTIIAPIPCVGEWWWTSSDIQSKHEMNLRGGRRTSAGLWSSDWLSSHSYEVLRDQEQKRDSKENVTRKLSEWGVFQVSSLVALAKNLSVFQDTRDGAESRLLRRNFHSAVINRYESSETLHISELRRACR